MSKWSEALELAKAGFKASEIKEMWETKDETPTEPEQEEKEEVEEEEDEEESAAAGLGALFGQTQGTSKLRKITNLNSKLRFTS